MSAKPGKASRPAGQAAHSLRSTAERIDRALPQLQCRACGYAGCRPYADALASGAAGPDRCAPGGPKLAAQLAQLAGLPADLVAAPAPMPPPLLAEVDEERCVGCIKCIEACPVDAVVGSFGLAHAVLADWCTGCGLCVEPCPTDCISMQPALPGSLPAQLAQAAHSGTGLDALAGTLRARSEAKLARPSLRNPAAAGASSPAELAAAAQASAQRSRLRRRVRAGEG